MRVSPSMSGAPIASAEIDVIVLPSTRTFMGPVRASPRPSKMRTFSISRRDASAALVPEAGELFWAGGATWDGDAACADPVGCTRPRPSRSNSMEAVRGRRNARLRVTRRGSLTDRAQHSPHRIDGYASLARLASSPQTRSRCESCDEVGLATSTVNSRDRTLAGSEFSLARRDPGSADLALEPQKERAGLEVEAGRERQARVFEGAQGSAAIAARESGSREQAPGFFVVAMGLEQGVGDPLGELRIRCPEPMGRGPASDAQPMLVGLAPEVEGPVVEALGQQGASADRARALEGAPCPVRFERVARLLEVGERLAPEPHVPAGSRVFGEGDPLAFDLDITAGGPFSAPRFEDVPKPGECDAQVRPGPARRRVRPEIRLEPLADDRSTVGGE